MVAAMIIAVTTTSMITTIAALGLTSAIAVVVAVALVVFLVTKELAGTSQSRFSLRLAKLVSISIAPLAIAFVVTLAVKIVSLV